MATADEMVGERYMALVRELPLRRLRDESDLDRAIAMIDKLVDLGMSRRSPDESEYMEVLAILVEQYEDIHYPMGDQLGPEEGLLTPEDSDDSTSSSPSDPSTE